MTARIVLPESVPEWFTPERAFVGAVVCWCGGLFGFLENSSFQAKLLLMLLGAVLGGGVAALALRSMARWFFALAGVACCLFGLFVWSERSLGLLPSSVKNQVLLSVMVLCGLLPLLWRTMSVRKEHAIDGVFSMTKVLSGTLLVLLMVQSVPYLRVDELRSIGILLLFPPLIFPLWMARQIGKRIRWFERVLAGSDSEWSLAELKDETKRSVLPRMCVGTLGNENTVLVRSEVGAGTAFRGGTFVPLVAALPLGGLGTLRCYRDLRTSARLTALVCFVLALCLVFSSRPYGSSFF